MRSERCLFFAGVSAGRNPDGSSRRLNGAKCLALANRFPGHFEVEFDVADYGHFQRIRAQRLKTLRIACGLCAHVNSSQCRASNARRRW